ncbi:uncharacterized protein LY89DRAFT_774505 [Mollisia scopiformis]|uniref:DUF6604 domain-containing protein n=1 Tax=Mollisia scopiformis TaxID=149040 RepID=A0A194XEN3_MOLSC|nr:uncharacterized protein LY89DRAFT_774505 [Mollisia scopiformis]KUJ18633.1 hypothetical protein LY89DRAFT_774505 [Mollisia scopiformis]
MLPGNLFSTYERYKGDTDSFISYLYDTAVKCGYQYIDPALAITVDVSINTPLGGRKKGKARKEAKQKDNPDVLPQHPLPIIELVKQAKAIANSDKHIKVPLATQRHLQEAIDARKTCTAWFRERVDTLQNRKSAVDIEKSNSNHEYFIKVLDRIHDILKPSFEVMKPSPASLVEEAQDELDKNIINRFHGLEVEDTNMQEYDALPSVGVGTSSQSQSQTQEVAIDQDANMQFRVYCFFQDLHTLSYFLKQTWKDVTEAKLDQRTACMITNICMERVQTAEQVLIDLDPERFGKAPYHDIVSMIHPVRSFKLQPDEVGFGNDSNTNKNDNATVKEHERQGTNDSTVLSSEPDDYFFTNMFLILDKARRFMNNTVGFASVPFLNWRFHSEPHLKPENKWWPLEDVAISNIMLDLKLKITLEETEKMTQAARKSGYLEKVSDSQPPFADNTTTCLQSVLSESRVTISAVYQARILMDLKYLLAENFVLGAKPYAELLHSAAATISSLQMDWKGDSRLSKQELQVEFLKVREKQQLTFINDDIWDKANKLRRHLKNNIEAPFFVNTKQLWIDDPSTLDKCQNVPSTPRPVWWNQTQIPSDPTPDSIYTCLPMYCSLEELKLKVDMNKLGIGVANTHASILTIAHVYNAFKQNGLVDQAWPLLDRVIEAHISELFNGSLPTSNEQIFRRWQLRTGTPATAFAPGSRKDSPSLAQMQKFLCSLLKPNYASTQLSDYFNNNISSEILLHRVWGHEQANKKSSRTKDPISTLRDSVEKMLPLLDLDMIDLTRKCTTLLADIRKECNINLGIEEGSNKGRYHFVFSIYTGNKLFSGLQDELEIFDVAGKSHEMITHTAKMLQEFIKHAASPQQVVPLDVISNVKEAANRPPVKSIKKNMEKIAALKR